MENVKMALALLKWGIKLLEETQMAAEPIRAPMVKAALGMISEARQLCIGPSEGKIQDQPTRIGKLAD